MFEYILSILGIKCRGPLLGYTNGIVLSWGPSNFRAIRNSEGEEIGVIFSVNGYKHKGDVIVKYNEGTDLFDINLREGFNNKSGKIIANETGVFIDQVVSVIDNLVELTDNYEDQVKNDYKNLLQNE